MLRFVDIALSVYRRKGEMKEEMPDHFYGAVGCVVGGLETCYEN